MIENVVENVVVCEMNGAKLLIANLQYLIKFKKYLQLKIESLQVDECMKYQEILII